MSRRFISSVTFALLVFIGGSTAYLSSVSAIEPPTGTTPPAPGSSTSAQAQADEVIFQACPIENFNWGNTGPSSVPSQLWPASADVQGNCVTLKCRGTVSTCSEVKNDFVMTFKWTPIWDPRIKDDNGNEIPDILTINFGGTQSTTWAYEFTSGLSITFNPRTNKITAENRQAPPAGTTSLGTGNATMENGKTYNIKLERVTDPATCKTKINVYFANDGASFGGASVSVDTSGIGMGDGNIKMCNREATSGCMHVSKLQSCTLNQSSTSSSLPPSSGGSSSPAPSSSSSSSSNGGMMPSPGNF
jgi:hypothetical protein